LTKKKKVRSSRRYALHKKEKRDLHPGAKIVISAWRKGEHKIQSPFVFGTGEQELPDALTQRRVRGTLSGGPRLFSKIKKETETTKPTGKAVENLTNTARHVPR